MRARICGGCPGLAPFGPADMEKRKKPSSRSAIALDRPTLLYLLNRGEFKWNGKMEGIKERRKKQSAKFFIWTDLYPFHRRFLPLPSIFGFFCF